MCNQTVTNFSSSASFKTCWKWSESQFKIYRAFIISPFILPFTLHLTCDARCVVLILNTLLQTSAMTKQYLFIVFFFCLWKHDVFSPRSYFVNKNKHFMQDLIKGFSLVHNLWMLIFIIIIWKSPNTIVCRSYA